MDINEVIDILEQESDRVLPKKEKKQDFSFDEAMFNKIANFIVNLDPISLTDKQLEEVINLIDDLEVNVENIKESGNPSLANRSSIGKNQASKKWYRENKSRVKKKKEEFLRSKEGRKKIKDKEKNKGKEDRKNKYHTRIRSDRDDYEKREYGK